MNIDIDHLRSWTGREERQSELLTAAQVQRFYATFDRDGPLEEGAEAPLLIHLCLCQPAVPGSALGPDGHPARGGFLPPVPLPRRMWAGGSFTFHAAPRIGEVITRRSVIEEVAEKEGRSGTLCFVTVTHHIYGEDGPCVTERQDIVYRAKDARAATTPPLPAPRGEARRDLAPDPVLLFRYSALTFNGHRIHYDAPYVTGTEGYPGLIVHGPLQATLLAQMAADLRGAAPARFEFRSLSPIFDTLGFSLNARDEGEVLHLWTAAEGGPVAMQAEARW
ncbi:MaoC family dehydratase N-terminal domain-containing protein [Salipiger sp. H15]|uniref:MaoC family dehydratase N-terminal domain-containing protein n=1 Tax=Alloyangia sp. H15 TaxID=3029062 RepID=A0AAU8ANF3_9RHOB